MVVCAGMLVFSQLSCGGGGAASAPAGAESTTPPLVAANTTPSVPTIIAYSKSDSAGMDRGEDQFAVMRFTDEATSTVFFGTRFLNGTIKTISQSITKMLGSRVRVRTYYDAGRRPVLLIDELSLKSILVQYVSTSVRFTVYDLKKSIVDYREMARIGNQWSSPSFMNRLTSPRLYSAQATANVQTANPTGRYDFQMFIMRDPTTISWSPDSRSMSGFQVEWPTGKDEVTRATESSIGIPYTTFLQRIVAPPAGRTVAPTLDISTLGNNSADTRCPLIDAIRSSTALTQEEMDRFGQAVAAYPLLDYFAQKNLTQNTGVTVERSFADPDWQVLSIAEVGSYPIPAAISTMVFHYIAPSGQIVANIAGAYASSNVLPYFSISRFSGLYDENTDSISGILLYGNADRIPFVARGDTAIPPNQFVTPQLMRGIAVWVPFDMNQAASTMFPLTNSAPGSPDYLLEDNEVLTTFYDSPIPVKNWRTNANTEAMKLLVTPGRRFVFWKRTTSSPCMLRIP
jgi:hypothetical protein